MSLVSTEDRGSLRVITYANPPFGTLTGTGSAELFGAVLAAGEEPSVRVIVITGGVPGIFIRHYDVGELSMPQKQFTALCHSRLGQALDDQAFVLSPTRLPRLTSPSSQRSTVFAWAEASNFL
jgi:enoyl-CoA hydratase/carnithine racemase